MAASFGLSCPMGSHHFFLRPKLRPEQQQKRSSPVASTRRNDGGSDHGQHFGGRLVDQNMVTLRKRIHEIRMAENTNSEEIEEEEEEAPSDWMEWERRYYNGSYASDVSNLIGMLQVLLLNVRPGVALTTMAALALSMPASMLIILIHLLQAH